MRALFFATLIAFSIFSASALESVNYRLEGSYVILTSSSYTLSVSQLSAESESANYRLISTINWYPVYLRYVSPFLLGDVNGDGKVDFNDLIATLNLILSNNYNPAADIDGDGNIDFNDLIGVLNMILAG